MPREEPPSHVNGTRTESSESAARANAPRATRHGDREAVRRLRRQRRSLPSQAPHAPHDRRLRYVRYADDWLLGFAGPKHEANEITSRIRAFLRDELARALSVSKTLITHATRQAARFLGDEVRAQHADDKLDRRGQRAVNAAIGLVVPTPVIRQRRARSMSQGKPAQRGALLHADDVTLVAKYQAEARGLVPYDLLAQDGFRLGQLHGVMETSRLQTLAGKPRSPVMKRARTYKATIETPEGPPACLQVTVEREGGRKPRVARVGGLPLRRQRPAVLTDLAPVMASPRRHALLHRRLTECCEVCAARGPLEVHHVRQLADLNPPGRRERPAWRHLRATRRRTTLVVCRRCHEAIHVGRAPVPVRK
jgi:hypothetical protein